MHGVHGEVKVFPTTSDVKRYKKLKEVYLDTKDKMNESDMIKLTLTGVKFFKQFAIVKFEGYDIESIINECIPKELSDKFEQIKERLNGNI